MRKASHAIWGFYPREAGCWRFVSVDTRRLVIWQAVGRWKCEVEMEVEVEVEVAVAVAVGRQIIISWS